MSEGAGEPAGYHALEAARPTRCFIATLQQALAESASTARGMLRRSNAL